MDENRPKDPIGFVREVVRKALWEIRYHENALPNAYRTLEFAEELYKRCGFESQEIAEPETNEEGDLIFVTLEQFVGNILDEQRAGVKYYEQEITQAHNELAFVKVMLARGNYTVDIAEIQKDLEEGEKKQKESKAR